MSEEKKREEILNPEEEEEVTIVDEEDEEQQVLQQDDEEDVLEEDDEQKVTDKYDLISKIMMGRIDPGDHIKYDNETTATFVYGDIIGHVCYVNKCNAPLMWSVSNNGDIRIACQNQHKGVHNTLFKKLQQLWMINYYKCMSVNNTFMVCIFCLFFNEKNTRNQFCCV